VAKVAAFGGSRTLLKGASEIYCVKGKQAPNRHQEPAPVAAGASRCWDWGAPQSL